MRELRKVYRFTVEGEGVFIVGKRLLPNHLVDEVLERKKWLVKPKLPSGEYRFYLTEKGRQCTRRL